MTSTYQTHICPLCAENSRSHNTVFPYRTLYNGNYYEYIKCDVCATVFVDPTPDAKTFSKMYAKSEYHDCYYESSDNKDYIESANLLSHYLPANSTILDYGCGLGGFLTALKNKGLIPYGVEFDRNAAITAAKKTSCDVMSVDQFLKQSAKPIFDAIHFGDVLEHLPDPASTLEELLCYLKPNGVCFIEGPLEINPSPVYWASRIFGGFKRLVNPHSIATHAPTHLFRASSRQQLDFILRVMPSCKLKYWEIYETGWPYSGGGAIKRAIASLAMAIGGKEFFGIAFGNRFRGIFIHPKPSVSLAQLELTR